MKHAFTYLCRASHQIEKDSIYLRDFTAVSILALAISFSKTFQPAAFYSSFALIAEEKRHPFSLDDRETAISASSYSLSSFSLPASCIIQSHLPSSFLFDIFTGVPDDEGVYSEEASLHPDIFFEIIFRLIISPNAP